MRKQPAFLLFIASTAVAAADWEPNAASPHTGDRPSAVRPRSGTFDVNIIDRSVDPCVDFYQFACGGWRKANPIPADESRWGRFNELADHNRSVLHEILERSQNIEGKRSPIETKVGDYYAACMDEAGLEAKGAKPLEPILARVEAVGSRSELFRLLGDNEAHALPSLFPFGSAPDLHDSRQTIATLGQGGLGLPDRDDYIKDDAKSKEKREKYVEHVTRMLGLLGESAEQAVADAQTVVRIETELAKAHLDRVSMRDPRNRDNPMTVEELKRLAPAFDFDAYFLATGASRFQEDLLEMARLARGRSLSELPVRKGGLPLQP
jgi:putative endopeptidase